MLLQKYRFVALALLLVLTGLMNVSAQTQQKPKYKELPTEGPKPLVQLSEHAAIITPCGDYATEARIPLTATLTNFTTATRGMWRVSGGRLNGGGLTLDGPFGEVRTVTWDLTGAAAGTYTARVEVDSDRDDGCVAFTSTRIVVRPCPPPVLCPNITISGPDTTYVGARVTFTANVSGGTPGITPIYNWTITAGSITSGQGTPSITVDTTGLGGQGITANISVEGYNLNCATSYTVQIPRPKLSAIMCDDYGPLKRDDEKARLDNCAIAVQNDPTAKLYIITYGGPNSTAAERQKRLKFQTGYLLERGVDPARIVTRDGGARSQGGAKLWIVPLGADSPFDY